MMIESAGERFVEDEFCAQQGGVHKVYDYGNNTGDREVPLSSVDPSSDPMACVADCTPDDGDDYFDDLDLLDADTA